MDCCDQCIYIYRSDLLIYTCCVVAFVWTMLAAFDCPIIIYAIRISYIVVCELLVLVG